MIQPTEALTAELSELIAVEHRIEKLLERASRAPGDPRASAWLWAQATECRDHARILLRHREMVARHAPTVPYPRWKRGGGPDGEEALREARDLSRDIARSYEDGGQTGRDPYLRKFLMILAQEHDARSHELTGLAAGEGIFEDAEILDD